MAGSDQALIEAYWQSIPERVARATDLWFIIEEGDQSQVEPLQRLLHTAKGEAHMLGLEAVGSLLQAVEDLVDRVVAPPPEAVGDSIMAALDGVAILAISDDREHVIDITELQHKLEEALQLVGDGLHEQPSNGAQRDAAEARGSSSGQGRASAQHETTTFDPIKMHQMVSESRRLHRELGLTQPLLREVRRMLRALLAEIDPDLPPAKLAERVTKTLGYGSQVERRLAELNARWSGSDFALDQSLGELDEYVRGLAMVSVAALRSQILRTARTTAAALGKEVTVELTGDAHVDATVERLLGPALLHLVRNAVDHGVETPAARVKAGKPARGHVDVWIGQSDANVTVLVKDDGAGIDIDKVRERVAAYDPAGAKAPDHELLPRVFEHGLSTRATVSEISGRGVGLDVVAQQVTRVGGTVGVTSVAGKGTRFELVLPTTLRADVVMPVIRAGVRMAVPVRAVVAAERIRRIIETEDGIRLARGGEGKAELVPLYDLGRVLGFDESIREGDLAVVVTQRLGDVAFKVDSYDIPRVMSFERMDELPIDSHLTHGVAPSPDGGVFILLKLDELHNSYRRTGATAAPGRRRTRRVPHVLVVEDAPVARELLLGILRSFGLRVSDATDGREGLTTARAERPDMILTDVEMPFLGGLEMLAELRRDPEIRETPVVVLTTRKDKETRQRAEALGVRYFLTKQKFVESELREVIDGCLGK